MQGLSSLIFFLLGVCSFRIRETHRLSIVSGRAKRTDRRWRKGHLLEKWIHTYNTEGQARAPSLPIRRTGGCLAALGIEPSAYLVGGGRPERHCGPHTSFYRHPCSQIFMCSDLKEDMSRCAHRSSEWKTVIRKNFTVCGFEMKMLHLLHFLRVRAVAFARTAKVVVITLCPLRNAAVCKDSVNHRIRAIPGKLSLLKKNRST